MAISLNTHVVADLCLGKPSLKALSLSASISDALSALRASDDTSVSIWACDHRQIHRRSAGVECRCVGKVCMADILCFLCKDENLASPALALQSPVSGVLGKDSGFVQHVEPSTSLLEAISLILQGAHNLIVPIQAKRNQQKPFSSKVGPTSSNGGQEYCWLTQEDLIRFILSRIGLFTPIPAYSIEDLGIVSMKTLAVDYHSPASLSTHLLAQTLITQTSLAVVDELDGSLVGEISPSALAAADETTAAAIKALSCGDLMAYIDNWGPPEDLVKVVKQRLKEEKLDGLLALFDDDSSSSVGSFSSLMTSSDDEDSVLSSSMLSPRGQLRRCNRSWSYSVRTVRRVQEITCHPGSSLVAVMIQAIAHRVNYVWVVECDNSLVGIVTFNDMLGVFYEYLQSIIDEA